MAAARSWHAARDLLAEWQEEQATSSSGAQKRKASIDEHIIGGVRTQMAQPSTAVYKEWQEFYRDTPGIACPEHVAALTISIGEGGIKKAKEKGDVAELQALSAIQGTYYLVGSYKQ